MPVTSKKITSKQRIKRAIELHQFRLDDYREVPDPHLHCQFCGGSILLDYIGLGYQEMNQRLMAWISHHSTCPPKLVTKTSAMMLTPKEWSA